MSIYTLNNAISEVLAQEMRRDSRVLVFGVNAAAARPELQNEFGPQRVRDTPASARVVVGTAIGAAAGGLRPVADLLALQPGAAIDVARAAHLIQHTRLPLVVLFNEQRNQDLHATFAHSTRFVVVSPGSASEFAALLRAAIRDDHPVAFCVDTSMNASPDEFRDIEQVIPLGKAAVLRKGCDVTLVSYGRSVRECLRAAAQLATNGVSADVIDLRTLRPLDEGTLLRSVHKTGRLIVVQEPNRLCGIGAEIAALVSEKAFDALTSPVARLAGNDPDESAPQFHRQRGTPLADTIHETALRLVEQAAAA